MGKQIKGTKRQLIDLLDAVDKIPSSKVASEIDKHLSFRKALKKLLKDYLDKKAEYVKKFQDAQKQAKKDVASIELKLKTAEGEEKIAMETVKTKINSELNKVLEEVNALLEALWEELGKGSAAVTFDNEAFLFESTAIRDNLAVLFKIGDDKLDNDKVESVLDLLSSAVESTK